MSRFKIGDAFIYRSRYSRGTNSYTVGIVQRVFNPDDDGDEDGSILSTNGIVYKFEEIVNHQRMRDEKINELLYEK